MNCHSTCAQWDGSGPNHWTTWLDGLYLFNSTCLASWPVGYYEDIVYNECRPCNVLCTQWFGPSRFECTACNNTLYLIASINNECKVVSCIDGYYLNTTDLLCYDWAEGWASWAYPNANTCQQCQSDYIMTSNGTCSQCNLVSGYVVNEFGRWNEIWGDGMYLGQYEWDDGNLDNGDGWSNTWKIETGFSCNQTSCWENVRPTAQAIIVSTDNLITINFSEKVKILDHERLVASLQMTISGSLQPYKFDFSVVYPIAENINNSNFTKMKIQISNINKNLYGGGAEMISIYFTDLTVITDIGGNIFAEQTITANLNQYEYLSEGNFIYLNNWYRTKTGKRECWKQY